MLRNVERKLASIRLIAESIDARMASFNHLSLQRYRYQTELRGRKHQNCNLGIVIMDEAFSKLSGDRIDDCLALARNFGLQLIMAFPEDRLPTMIQHAETVVQCRVHRTYDEASGQIQNIENWCIRVDRERLIENLL